MDMEIRHCKYFVALAETKSQAQAAERCNVTGPAIGTTIDQIEDKLKIKLFYRKKKQFILTKEGEELYKKAKTVLASMDQFCEEGSVLGNLEAGELRLGVGNFIEPYIREAAIKMLNRYPNLKLHVTFAPAAHLNRMLCDHEIDIAFTLNSADATENIVSEECIPYHLRVIMPKNHVLASKDVISFDDILNSKVLLPDCSERVLNSVVKGLRKKYDLSKMNVIAVVSAPDAILKALPDLNSISFMPAYLVHGYDDLIAKPIEGAEDVFYTKVHSLKGLPLKKSAKVFCDYIRDHSVPYFKAMDI